MTHPKGELGGAYFGEVALPENRGVSDREAKNTMRHVTDSCRLCLGERFVIDTTWWKSAALRLMAYLSIFVNWMNKKIGSLASVGNPVLLHCPKCSTGLPAKVGEWGPFSKGVPYTPPKILKVRTRQELLSDPALFGTGLMILGGGVDFSNPKVEGSGGPVPITGRLPSSDAREE